MRVAVVTGASSGVGLAVCRGLVGRGWRVFGLARDPGKLALAAGEGAAFEPVAVDVRQAHAVQAAFGHIAAQAGGIDLLVNNAAVFKMAPFAACTVADIDALIDTNLKGTLYCTHAALPLLRDGVARIVDVSSVAGTHGLENQAIYCASKHGMNGFGEALNQELVRRGISLTTICPGGIATPLWNPSNPYPGDLDRILRAEEVADLVLHVADLPPHVLLKQMVVFPTNEWH